MYSHLILLCLDAPDTPNYEEEAARQKRRWWRLTRTTLFVCAGVIAPQLAGAEPPPSCCDATTFSVWGWLVQEAQMLLGS